MSTHIDTFAVGETKEYRGSLNIKIITAVNEVDLEFLNSQGSRIDLIKGVSQGDSFQRPQGFHQVNVISATAQTVKIQILDLVMTSSALIGDVNAISELKNKTLTGNEFIAGTNAAAAAGQVSALALVNPTLSGVKLNVNRAVVEVTSVVNFGYMPIAAVAGWTAWKSIMAISSQDQNYNKLGGGADSVADILFTTNALNMQSFLTVFASSFAPADVFSESKPYIVDEGYALVMFGGVNNYVKTHCEWSEE